VNKQVPTFGRLTAMVLFAASCFGLLLFLWLSFGGAIPLKPKGYRVDVPFREAAQLGEQADVRVAGVPIGRVAHKRVAPGRPDVIIATLEIDPEFAPLRADTRATLREKTLIGETYVELTLGRKGAGTIQDGGALPAARVEEKVQLDEILDTFDPYTRESFRTWQRSLATALNDRGSDLNDTLGNLPGWVSTTGDLVEALDADREALRSLVRNTGEVFEALTVDEEQLRRLIDGTDRTYAAIARRSEAFADIWQVFPTFLRESRRTSQTLEGFAGRATPVLRDLAPATEDLAATLRALGRAAPDLRRFLVGLDPLAAATREGLPASTEIFRGLRPLVQSLEPYLGELNPTLAWIGEHSYTLTDMLSNLGVATAAKTGTRDPQGTGHYLRQYGPTGAESLGGHPRRLSTNRGNTYLNPMTLNSRTQGLTGMTASWDCANSDGNSGPLCRIDPPYTFQGETRRFPHVQAERYRDGRTTLVPTPR
jgi:phospholipid/cholesterol/gamma-HCH transport system substrate-binding protein